MSIQLALQPRIVGPSRSNPALSAPEPRLRLTRRGRLVLVVLPLMLATAVVMLLAGAFTAPAKASGSLSAPETVTVTVGAGQTLWDIATLVAPERHPQDVIAEIAELNGLDGSIVQAGQQVFVPSPR